VLAVGDWLLDPGKIRLIFAVAPQPFPREVGSNKFADIVV